MCDFCKPDVSLRARMFYQSQKWFAILAAPPNLRGHAIFVADGQGSCPTELNVDVLGGIDVALDDVTRALRAHYSPKHVVFASLRVMVPHFHLHVFAVSEEDERRWRAQKGAGYETGHFFEFLGDQDRAAWLRNEEERREKKWTVAEQLEEHTRLLLPDVESLRRIVETTRKQPGSQEST